MKEQFLNVEESWPIYDSIIVCKELYGKEQNINGWFNSFVAFAAQETHTFFKNRTQGNSHLAYTNMQSADNVDFVFHAYSFGVRFFAPITPDSVTGTITSRTNFQEGINSFWLFDLPRHCGIDLRIQQDVVIENTCMASPPGYGPRGGGGTQSLAAAESSPEPIPYQDPWQTVVGSQSEPVIDCRFKLPSSLKIARNTPIESTLFVSPYARHVLGQLYNNSMAFPKQFQTGDPSVMVYDVIPSRWGIQVSLFGNREVQQRGQYFATGFQPEE